MASGAGLASEDSLGAAASPDLSAGKSLDPAEHRWHVRVRHFVSQAPRAGAETGQGMLPSHRIASRPVMHTLQGVQRRACCLDIAGADERLPCSSSCSWQGQGTTSAGACPACICSPAPLCRPTCRCSGLTLAAPRLLAMAGPTCCSVSRAGTCQRPQALQHGLGMAERLVSREMCRCCSAVRTP